ncbi:MAG: hypothetical protein KKF06_04925 [Candidatus Margulisbacteria bacterium]|nr:hypothetical protein [Candidatus Margulisiibacteriota bacterium]
MNWSIALSLFDKIAKYSPNSGFLSDIAMVEGVIIGIAIPLSYEIIARLSDRYNSDVITRKFRDKPEIKYLPCFLAINLLVIVVIKFIEGTGIYHKMWAPIAWGLLIGFIIIAAWLLRFFHLLVMHADPDYILRELSEDANNALQ